MTRLPPLPPAEWPPAMREALAALRPAAPRHPFPPADPSRPKGLNVLGLLAHHPELARAFHTFDAHVLYGTTLTPRQCELLVLRVAVRRDAAYEWAQHVLLADDAGITADEVARIRVGDLATGWPEPDGALLAAVDELLDDGRIGDGTWARLQPHLGAQELMDVVFTVGAYDLLAMALATFDVELDDDLRAAVGNDLLL